MPISPALDPDEVTTDIFDLTGRRVVVTGASRGLGRQLAIAFAKFGARVACVARNEEVLRKTVAEINKAGGVDASYFAVELRTPEAIARTISSLAEEYGGMDALVKNAADGPDSSLADTS